MDDARTNDPRLTGPMRRVEARLGRSLEAELRDRYVTRGQTMAQVGAALGVSESTIHHWMRRLDIEARFPGQRARVA
jgi:transposase